MPLTSDLKPWYIKTLPGMNNKLEVLEKQDKWVNTAQNCRFEDEPGSVDKRSPLTYYNDTSLGLGESLGIYRYYGSSGNIKTIYCWNTSVYVGNDGAGTLTPIRTNLTSGKRMSFETYRNLVIGSNGFDNIWVYDGSADNITWELGSCKAKVGAGTGITATSISYQVTMDGDVYTCGAVSNTVSAATNQSIDLTNIPLGPIGTADRKIYRKDSGTGGAYKLVTTIANNTATTYTDTATSGSLGTTIPPVTDDMPKGSILQVHRERLFISGDPNEPNRIYFSNVYAPWFIQVTTQDDFLDIDRDDGDEIMGIPIQLGVMVCIKKNTCRKVYVSSPTSGADPDTWYAEDPSAWVGARSQGSIVQSPRGIVFLGWDHWYIYDGATVAPCIDEFDVENVLPSSFSKVVCYYLQTDVLLAAYTDRTLATTFNNRLMLFNFRRNALAYDTVNVSAITAQTGDDESGEIIYGDSTQGFIYKTEVSDIFYKLQRKSDANLGTLNSVFVGGTEASPLIEIGAITSAVAIPNDVCIFWDDTASTPGSGWTEITGIDDKYIKISTGTLQSTGNVTYSVGDMTSISYSSFRLFKKNATTTEYVFPEGAVVLWDSPGIPDGFQEASSPTNYIRVNATSVTGGTESVYIKASPQVSFDSVDYTTLVFNKASHGLSNGYRVKINGTTIPTGLDSSISYYVITASAGSFQISLTNGGAVVSFTSNGTAVYYTRSDGTNFDNTVAFRFIKKVGEQSTWDGVNQYVYCLYNSASAPGLDWTDITSTYEGRYLIVGDSTPTVSDGDVTTKTSIDLVNLTDTAHTYSGSATDGALTIDGDDATYMSGTVGWSAGAPGNSSVYSEHGFLFPRTITSVKYKVSASASGSGSTDNGCTVRYHIQYALDSDPATWVTFTGLSAESNQNSGGGGGSTSASVSGNATSSVGTIANVIKIRALVTIEGYANESGGGSATGYIYTIEAYGPPSQYVTFRLSKKILGKMQDYNAAILTPYTNGTWISPGIQTNAETFGEMQWNELKDASDEIDFFTRTGATQASVENGTACVADNTANKFTAVGHGLVNTNRVTLDATVMPTGIVKTRVYFVVGVAGSDFQVALTSGGSAVDFTTNGTSVTFKKWEGPMSDPNGVLIPSTANIWIQYLIAFTAVDTTVSSPRVYFVDGYVVQFSYIKGRVYAEASVEFIYSIGKRNFDEPFVDKIFKKIVSWHQGDTGSLKVQWETEENSGEFVIDLQNYPTRWESFFPDTAWGRELNLTFYKNDLNTLKLKEFSGIYTPEPIIV
jgi:hypothetical protein